MGAILPRYATGCKDPPISVSDTTLQQQKSQNAALLSGTLLMNNKSSTSWRTSFEVSWVYCCLQCISVRKTFSDFFKRPIFGSTLHENHFAKF